MAPSVAATAGTCRPDRPTDINAVEWWQAFRSRRVIASTRLMVREIVAGFEMDPDHVRRVPHGINPSWWATPRPDEPKDQTRSKLVLAWGRVQYEKGFHVLARAVATLRHGCRDSSA